MLGAQGSTSTRRVRLAPAAASSVHHWRHIRECNADMFLRYRAPAHVASHLLQHRVCVCLSLYNVHQITRCIMFRNSHTFFFRSSASFVSAASLGICLQHQPHSWCSICCRRSRSQNSRTRHNTTQRKNKNQKQQQQKVKKNNTKREK